MLAAASELVDGVNTYLMPPQHVGQAREVLGHSAALNTMLFCLNESDPAKARATARKAVQYYMDLDYYHRAWRSFGFNDTDFANGGSDALIDTLVAWGDTDHVRERIHQQYANGATRVVVIPIGGQQGQPDWQLLNAVSN